MATALTINTPLLLAGSHLPLLRVAHLPQEPHMVGFAVGSISGLDLQAPSSITLDRSLRSLPVLHIPQPGEIGQYRWDFGNGKSLDTMGPSVYHDFSDSLDPTIDHQSFDIKVNAGAQSITRTLTFTNLYAEIERVRNELHATATVTGFATRESNGFRGTFTIENVEQQAFVLEECRYEALTSDSEIVSLSDIVRLRPPILVAAKQIHATQIFAPFEKVSRTCLGFGVYLHGRALGSASGVTVRANCHFDLNPKQRPKPRSLMDLASEAHLQGILAALQACGRQGMSLNELRSAAPLALPFHELHRPIFSNEINGLPSWSTPESTASLLRLTNRLQREPPISEGEECDPDNLPTNVPIGFACQATSGTRVVTTPGRFMNARKGDVACARREWTYRWSSHPRRLAAVLFSQWYNDP